MRFSIIIILIVCLASCRKEDNVRSLAPIDTWVVENTIFYKGTVSQEKQKQSLSSDSEYVYIFRAQGNEKNSLNLYFYEKPPADGKYKIVYQPRATDEVSIEEWQDNNGHSGSQDNSGKTLEVVTENGKRRFIVEEVQLEHYTFVVNYDYDCSINITE